MANSRLYDILYDMITSLQWLQQEMLWIPGCEQHKSIPHQNFHHILLEGDQVTAVCALQHQSVRRNSKQYSDKQQLAS